VSVRVEQIDGELRVVATRPFRAGEAILRLEGDVTDRPSRYSLQVEDDRHLVVPTAGAPERYPWRFLNHSCAPNAGIRGREVIALRDIEPPEQITFDYNTTEYDMAEPFVCRCGTCGGREIAGFRHLTPEQQARLRPYLAGHLLRRLR
jgi:hypothetical protein